MNNNGPRTEGLMKIKHHLQDEHKEIKNGRIVGEGQGRSEENELRINEDAEDVDDGQMEAVQDKVQTQVVMQSSQQQHQRPLVRWERFLPLRSLKVLLVENDDSTRHVVSALLRNCGYEGRFYICSLYKINKKVMLKWKLQYNFTLTKENLMLFLWLRCFLDLLKWFIMCVCVFFFFFFFFNASY